MKNRSLVSQFRITLLWIVLSTILASLLTYLFCAFLFLYGLNHQKFYPANYYESQIPRIQDYVNSHSGSGIRALKQEELEKRLQGESIFYQLSDKNGKTLGGTYDAELFSSKEMMYQRLNSTFAQNRFYIHTIPVITDTGTIDGAVSVIYSLNIAAVNHANPWILAALLLVLCSPFLYLILFTVLFSRYFAGTIKKPLQILADGTKQIMDNNLDFTLDYQADNELGALCQSFRAMQNALRNSLSAQWKMEQERTENLQALAHDLKSPLSIIKAYTESLADDTDADAEQLHYLSVIEKNTDKSISLVNQMQYTAQLASPDIRVEKSPVDLKALLFQKKTEYELRAKDKQVEIQVRFAPNVPAAALTDQNKLERILDNVLLNSIEAVPTPGKIEITVEADEAYIHYSVSDNGRGFDARDLSKALERFYRGDASRSTREPHSGLGLYIVKQLSELLGGSVELSNTSAGGACVKFWHGRR